jgi:hypothetical protein
MTRDFSMYYSNYIEKELCMVSYNMVWHDWIKFYKYIENDVSIYLEWMQQHCKA